MVQQHKHMQRHPNGLIAVDQGQAHGFALSYNSDDKRFYVHELDENDTVLGTFKEFRNARQFARTARLKRDAAAQAA
jgi:hypothetical protein